MNQTETLTTFSQKFVREEFRDRFVHEAKKKPRDLHRRICHEIEKVFESTYKGQAINLQPNDQCLFLAWSSEFIETSWKDAQAVMAAGGGGYLVVKLGGSAFYAETEAYPAVIYAGGG